MCRTAGNGCDPVGSFRSLRSIFRCRFSENAQARSERGSFDVFRKFSGLLQRFARANALLHAGKIRGFWRSRNGCTNRIEIDIDHAGDDGGLNQKRDRFEATLPEMSGAPVFAIGLTSEPFFEALHKPRERTQAQAGSGIHVASAARAARSTLLHGMAIPSDPMRG